MEPKFINQTARKGFDFIGDKSSFGKLSIDPSSHLNDATIDMTGGVIIGKRVHFGHQVILLTTSHPPEILDGEKRMEALRYAGIVILDDAYVGSRSIILGGTVIGKSSYIGAGSLVLENTIIKDYELWAGSPAHYIRKLK
jgi:acetyltransferase-like isoleucine patch superfamily enzyme